MERRGDVLARRAWAEREERADMSDERQPKRVVGRGARRLGVALRGREEFARVELLALAIVLPAAREGSYLLVRRRCGRVGVSGWGAIGRAAD
jgi:hypothetical protein